MRRRSFLKQSAAGLLILPSGIASGRTSPNNKLNLALIGVGGRGMAHFDSVSGENIVALCDVNERNLAAAAKKFPGVKTYHDWRRCLEHEGLDGIVCATTDHTHAPIAIWAMRRGLHVYCEKPLAITVEEARSVRATFLEQQGKLATQVGTQLHGNENFRKVRELIREGVVGELKSVDVWGNREIPKPGYLPAAGEPPEFLHYDLWLGPAPAHPYNPGYFGDFDSAQVPGSNCLNWNMYWDFGAGQVGDMGSHTMDLAWNALDAALPTRISADGEPFHPDVTPVRLRTTFAIPANDWRKEIELRWHQGGAMPEPPTDTALRGIGHGSMYHGTKGTLVCDPGSHVFIPAGTPRDARLSRTGVRGKFSIQEEWIKACKDGGTTSCNFDYASRMIETMLLGLVAYRAGKPVSYDGTKGSTGDATTDALLRRSYREGWPLVG
ncbi:MAG: Gfo/Idh/MocA family oxidoreductase [Akkermansiaceae bacterium]|nr:Gfo/Idh/MocA family oxidoreductase [Akkermansiaceae bacterium]MCP5544733.1 Gfo/Idh/MocA family oxidoreductase [Akkermansiaceae bacterium]MCP5545873.1 Gfo/Idh/MocA family oxidoreductase [Akkermansiaceae bacterium]